MEDYKEKIKNLVENNDYKSLDNLLKNLPEEERKKILNNPIDKFGNTFLHLSALNNKYEVTEILIKYGHDVNIENRSGETPLHSAASIHSYKIIDLLLRYKADPYKRDIYGQTPAHTLFRYPLKENEGEIIECVKVFMRYGYDINTPDKLGETLLHKALIFGLYGLAIYLIENGADLYQEDNFKKTPIQIIIEEINRNSDPSFNKLIKYLREKGLKL